MMIVVVVLGSCRVRSVLARVAVCDDASCFDQSRRTAVRFDIENHSLVVLQVSSIEQRVSSSGVELQRQPPRRHHFVLQQLPTEARSIERDRELSWLET